MWIRAFLVFRFDFFVDVNRCKEYLNASNVTCVRENLDCAKIKSDHYYLRSLLVYWLCLNGNLKATAIC